MKVQWIFLGGSVALSCWMALADMRGEVIAYQLGFGGKRYQSYNHK